MDDGRKRVVALAALWVVAMAGVSFVPGCYGHTCDGDFLVYGRQPGEGKLIDADTWETGPIDGRWVDFPHQRAYTLEMHDLGDRIPYDVHAFVSAQANPSTDPGGNFTSAAGNLTEIFGPSQGKVNVKNDTCADYFLYVVVKVPPRPPTAGTATPTVPGTDAGADAATDAEAGP